MATPSKPPPLQAPPSSVNVSTKDAKDKDKDKDKGHPAEKATGKKGARVTSGHINHNPNNPGAGSAKNQSSDQKKLPHLSLSNSDTTHGSPSFLISDIGQTQNNSSTKSLWTIASAAALAQAKAQAQAQAPAQPQGKQHATTAKGKAHGQSQNQTLHQNQARNHSLNHPQAQAQGQSQGHGQGHGHSPSQGQGQSPSQGGNQPHLPLVGDINHQSQQRPLVLPTPIERQKIRANLRGKKRDAVTVHHGRPTKFDTNRLHPKPVAKHSKSKKKSHPVLPVATVVLAPTPHAKDPKKDKDKDKDKDKVLASEDHPKSKKKGGTQSSVDESDAQPSVTPHGGDKGSSGSKKTRTSHTHTSTHIPKVHGHQHQTNVKHLQKRHSGESHNDSKGGSVLPQIPRPNKVSSLTNETLGSLPDHHSHKEHRLKSSTPVSSLDNHTKTIHSSQTVSMQGNIAPSEFYLQDENSANNNIRPVTDEDLLRSVRKCPTNITAKNETELVRSLLRYDYKHMMPVYGDGRYCAVGLEFLSNIETVHIVMRLINRKKGICYKLFSQYDIYNEEDTTLVGFGFEKSSFFTAYCCLDFRYFQIRLYDYNGRLFLRVVRSFTCASCCAKYFCCCCFFGDTGCGNLVQVFDGQGNLLGHIEQAPLLAKRLLAHAEIGDERVGDIIRQDYIVEDVLNSDENHNIFPELRIIKFNVYNHNNVGFVRIEQYMENSFICKFLCLDTFEQVGYARKHGDDRIEIDVWKDYSEEEKALLIAASFLIDHMVLQVSLDGSFYKESRLTEEGARKPVDCCYKFFCLNRCQATIYILFSVLIISLLVIIIFFAI